MTIIVIYQDELFISINDVYETVVYKQTMTSFRHLNRYSPSGWIKTLLDAQEKSNIFTLSLHMHHCRFSRGLAQRPVKTKEFRIGGTEWYERKQMMFASGSLLPVCACVCVCVDVLQ